MEALPVYSGERLNGASEPNAISWRVHSPENPDLLGLSSANPFQATGISLDQDIAVNISDTKNKKPVSSGLSVNESPNGSLEEEGDRNLLASSFISSRQRRSHASVETNSKQLDEVIFRKFLSYQQGLTTKQRTSSTSILVGQTQALTILLRMT